MPLGRGRGSGIGSTPFFVGGHGESQMNPYEILGIDKTATRDQIDVAYRAQAKKYHPDAGGEAWVFQQVQAAYEALTGGMSGTKTSRRRPDDGDGAEQRPATRGKGPEEPASSPDKKSASGHPPIFRWAGGSLRSQDNGCE